MLRLDLKREPFWLPLVPGVRVRVQPAGSPLLMAARHAVRSIAGKDDAAAGRREAAFIRTLAHLAILEWEGVGDTDGQPIAVSPGAIDALMDLFPVIEAFTAAYVHPALTLEQQIDAERKNSAPVPGGSSAAVPTIAEAVPSTESLAPMADPA